ncbi:MAG: sugar phosphate isomerase/epimerase [Archaeoglobaceae archaeon]|nr:sugar phosphate isomerase/epimerase [Archaeoglobaceae archaeon]MDW8117655.1 sugar phosphate isomerase/epimerase [Archaeoglobaceae archaeon]
MKIGTQPDIRHNPKEAFEFATNNGFEHVEILMDHPLYSPDLLSYNELIELKWSYDLELLIHSPSTTTNFIATSENMRKASYAEMQKVLHIADRAGAEVVTFHIGWNPGFINNGSFYFPQELFDEHNEKVLLKELKPFLKRTEILLSLENTVAIKGGIEKALKQILNETELALTLDLGHYNIQKCEFFLENFDRVVNVHLHDNNGDRDEHLALGRGKLDLSLFPLAEYDSYMTIETREENSILETREYLFRYLKGSL